MEWEQDDKTGKSLSSTLAPGHRWTPTLGVSWSGGRRGVAPPSYDTTTKGPRRSVTMVRAAEARARAPKSPRGPAGKRQEPIRS